MHSVRLARQAERSLRRILRGDPAAYRRLTSSIQALAENPRAAGSTKLSGIDPPAWRMRVGDYRIVYEIHDEQLVVIVVRVSPRGEVYR